MSRILKLLIVAISAATLSGCKKSEAEVLEANYHQTTEKRDFDKVAQCDEGRGIAAAWAREGNQEKYNEWKAKSDLDCMTAEVMH